MINKNKPHKCKYCNKEFETGVKLGGHTRMCPKNPNHDANYHSCYVEHKHPKPHTEEEKRKISASRKKYLMEHPEKVPYVLNHHSKGDSYPEQYFKTLFENEQIEYKQNYYQNGYFLDFAWPEQKKYLEIDGEQHYVDQRIVKHDKKRTKKLTKKLNDAGWMCIKRIRWSEYQKLDILEKQKLILEIKELLK